MFSEKRKIKKTTAKDPVIIWDAGGVFLHWNPMEFFQQYQNGEYIEKFSAVFKNGDWRKLDRGDLSSQDFMEFYSKAWNKPKTKIETILQDIFHSLKPKLPVVDLIRKLKKAGYEQYCLTNGSKEYMNYVNSEKYRITYNFVVYELFAKDKIILSADIHLLKPEPEIYKYTRDKFGLENRTIIFIDDTAENIKGARSAGWEHVIHFTGLEDCQQALWQLIDIDHAVESNSE